jgi:peptidoglycan-associated lipoprotein
MRAQTHWIKTMTVLAGGSLALALLFAGCATKGFVRSQIEANRQETASETHDLAQRTDSVEKRLDQISNSTDQAMARASSAFDVAEEARAQALGGLGYREAARYEVHFAFNSAQLDDDARKTLTRAAQDIENEPGKLVDIYGYADATGPAEYNLQLGQWRADGVMRFLVDHTPPPMSRYAAVSYGEKDAATGDTTPEARAKDRRVVVSLIEKVPAHEDVSQVTPKAEAD